MVEKKSAPEKATRTFKVLAFAVGGLLVGIGLCGIDSHLYPNAEFGGSSFAFVGVVLIVVSALVIVAALFALLVLGISRLGLK